MNYPDDLYEQLGYQDVLGKLEEVFQESVESLLVEFKMYRDRPEWGRDGYKTLLDETHKLAGILLTMRGTEHDQEELFNL